MTQATLEAQAGAWEATKLNDGYYLGPPQPLERPCFECPGPAPRDQRLYCTRTVEGTWIGFKVRACGRRAGRSGGLTGKTSQWYRFIDQPELNQFFASIPDAERSAASCFMQRRIERLHAAQGASGPEARWFDPPQGEDRLPADKVAIDRNLLLTPPAGMEVGFVPIPVYNRLRAKPDECDVVLGAVQEEPDPISADHFASPQRSDEREREMCVGNAETEGQPFPYPGTIYPKGPSPNPAAYAVPLRADVGLGLPATSATCGLPSDPGGGVHRLAAEPAGLCGPSAKFRACTTAANGQSCEHGGVPGGEIPADAPSDLTACFCRCYSGWAGPTCATKRSPRIRSVPPPPPTVPPAGPPAPAHPPEPASPPAPSANGAKPEKREDSGAPRSAGLRATVAFGAFGLFGLLLGV